MEKETGMVYSRHPAQVHLAKAISGPGTAQFCKEVREPNSFWLFKVVAWSNTQERQRDLCCETMTYDCTPHMSDCIHPLTAW